MFDIKALRKSAHTIIITVCLFPITEIYTVQAQQFRNPFEFPPLLSGNFGELRSNHFHSGIDFKTQGVEGKPVHVVQKGYISRISVSPDGYGNALYVNHPDGTTTVYGHLQRFSSSITSYVKEQQYAQESFSINLSPSVELLPVEKGEIIAWSGNTGGSGGPHLHFEVRDTETEEIIDPIVYFKQQLKDTRPPRIQGIMVYPLEGESMVNGKNRKQEFKLITHKGVQSLSGKIEAWGQIGLAIKAYDYMDNTSNSYGVKEIVLTTDKGEKIYRSYIDRYAFSETRYLNSFIDYEEWINNRSFYMKSFVEPGNRLRFIESLNRGILTINEPRTYRLTYTLKDDFGNTTKLSVEIIGKKQEIIPIDTLQTESFHWTTDNRFGAKGVRLFIPKGCLYTDLYFNYSVREDSTALAATHILHNKPVPFHSYAQLSIRLQQDPLENKSQYGIIRKHKGESNWMGGTYRNGWIDANIRELGTFTLAMDTIPPTITPLNKETASNQKQISFRLSDNLSGIQTYRGEIDGQFALFEMSNKRVITYRFDNERLLPGKHTLRLVVTDAAGNETIHTEVFNH